MGGFGTDNAEMMLLKERVGEAHRLVIQELKGERLARGVGGKDVAIGGKKEVTG